MRRKKKKDLFKKYWWTGLIFIVVVLIILFFGLQQATIPYDNQCSPSSCPSGYSEVNKYCDTSKNECYRVCEKQLAGSCGDYEKPRIVDYHAWDVDEKDDLDSAITWWHTTDIYYTDDLHCYKFYGKSTLLVDDWDPGFLRDEAKSAKVWARSSAEQSLYTTQCSNGQYDVSATDPTYKIGRGDGTGYYAQGSFATYKDTSCSGTAAYGIEGSLHVWLYISIAPWIEGEIDTKKVFCSYDCDRDSECDDDGYVGSPHCYNNNVYQTYKDYFCSNYECDYTETDKLKETCEFGCSGGICIIDDEEDRTVCCKITGVYPEAEPTYTWQKESYCSNIIDSEPIVGASRVIVDNSYCEDEIVDDEEKECTIDEDCKELAEVICDDGSLWYHDYHCIEEVCAISKDTPPESCIKTNGEDEEEPTIPILLIVIVSIIGILLIIMIVLLIRRFRK